MIEPPLGGQTVVVLQRDEDSDGDWTVTGRVPVAGCSIQPDTSRENTNARQQTVQRFTVFGPPPLAVARASDLLEVPGWTAGEPEPVVELHLDGPPSTWPDETGQPHHVELVASRTSG
jgi:hypothetical protein